MLLHDTILYPILSCSIHSAVMNIYGYIQKEKDKALTLPHVYFFLSRPEDLVLHNDCFTFVVTVTPGKLLLLTEKGRLRERLRGGKVHFTQLNNSAH